MDFFTRFTREKTPQNNFSSQNFSVENNYLSGPVRFFKVKTISAALAESKNCFYFVQINDSNDEEENSSIIFFFVIS